MKWQNKAAKMIKIRDSPNGFHGKDRYLYTFQRGVGIVILTATAKVHTSQTNKALLVASLWKIDTGNRNLFYRHFQLFPKSGFNDLSKGRYFKISFIILYSGNVKPGCSTSHRQLLLCQSSF